MAAAAASEVKRDLRITQSFEEYTYTIWKDYVLQCAQKNIPIESPKIEALALLTLLCHKFTKGNIRNYEKLFFELLCQALASSEDSPYRCRSSERRPQMFRDKPTAQVRKDYRFVWPVTVTLSNKYYVGIPSQYLQNLGDETQQSSAQNDAEESNSLCTILYLVVSDMAASFRDWLQNRSESSVEFPCLLNYFKMSPLNNQKQLPALVGEYLAFLNISLKLEFDQSWEFKPVEKSNDFEVLLVVASSAASGQCSTFREKNNTKKAFSVKSDNREGRLRYFKPGITDRSSTQDNPMKSNQEKGKEKQKKAPPTDSVILILNCDCGQCKLNPVVALQDTETLNENCKRSKAHKILYDIFSSLGEATQYVISAPIYFDLRFAMENCYKPGEEAALKRDEEKQRRQDKKPSVKKREGNMTSRNALLRLFQKCSDALSDDFCSDKTCLKWISTSLTDD